MTGPAPQDWDAVAFEKLRRVLGEEVARGWIDRGLRELGMRALTSGPELHRFGQWLTRQDGFAAAVGGLLSVHAVIHGTRPP